MINAAVVGLGWWGRHIIETLENNDRIKIVAATARRPDRHREFVESKGLTLHTGYSETLADPAVEAVILCKSIQTSTIAPTINYETPDPECDLDYTPNDAAFCDVKVAMSNSFGFGGHNACIVFGKYH